jgi:hypothetical protein
MKKCVIIAHLPLTFCFKHLPRKNNILGDIFHCKQHNT